MDYAYRYMIANNGDDTERSYPYEMRKGNCRFNQNNVADSIKTMSVPLFEAMTISQEGASPL